MNALLPILQQGMPRLPPPNYVDEEYVKPAAEEIPPYYANETNFTFHSAWDRRTGCDGNRRSDTKSMVTRSHSVSFQAC